MAPIVPPIKCQGIKTKLVSAIKSVAPEIKGQWIEPFCGSCVVLFNLQPERATITDTNEHIIELYNAIKSGRITAGIVSEYLKEQGEALRKKGEDHFYEMRESFNANKDSLTFLFLNRSCFNGVMRFNKKGKFNVPFCRKPTRFAQAYITKIVNQVKQCSSLLRSHDWTFMASGFRETLAKATPADVVYADPPYAGRHVDYYNSWSEDDEKDLAELLKNLPCQFILSTWYKNKYRTNPLIETQWSNERYVINTQEHFYHVGSSESLRHAMTEAIITNYSAKLIQVKKQSTELLELMELGKVAT